MRRSRRGSGSVFQRTHRDVKGRNRKTKNWYIEFVAGSRTMRIADAFGGNIILSRNLTCDVRALISTDDTNNARARVSIF